MSKKSRKRNKRIISVLAAGLGAAALAKRKRNKAIDIGIASAEADKGSDMAPSSIQVKPPTIIPTPRKKNFLASPKWSNLDTSEVNTDYVAPSTKRYNNPDFGFGIQAKDGGRIGKKSGGRTGYKSGGAAKRGVSPILLKGKK